jgi:anti-sigma regulatory factor (Ser/Thr protein kinase)
MLTLLYGLGILSPAGRRGDEHVLQLELAPSAHSPGVARRAILDACRVWGVPEVADDACLAVSELVTNAVVHAGTPAMLTAHRDGQQLRIAVTDGDAHLPRLERPDSEAEGGRGVAVVDQLGATWGVQQSALGKTVWVSLRLGA